MDRFRYHTPLDPECPVWSKEISTFFDDPMTEYSGIADEHVPVMEDKHRKVCKRCQEFGCANIEVVD